MFFIILFSVSKTPPTRLKFRQAAALRLLFSHEKYSHASGSAMACDGAARAADENLLERENALYQRGELLHLGIRSARRGQENARKVGVVLVGAELILDIFFLDVKYFACLLYTSDAADEL